MEQLSSLQQAYVASPAPTLTVITCETKLKVVSPVIYRAITGLCSYLGLTLISMSIANGMLSIVVSGTFTLALVTNHNGMYLINTPCNAKVLSRNMLDIITCILAYYGLMLISASISNGRLIVVCARDASIPPPAFHAVPCLGMEQLLAQVAVVYVCEVFAMALNVPLLANGMHVPTPVIVTLPTPVVSTLMTVSLVKVMYGNAVKVSAMALNVPLLANGMHVTGFGQVVCMHPFWFLPCLNARSCVLCNACAVMSNTAPYLRAWNSVECVKTALLLIQVLRSIMAHLTVVCDPVSAVSIVASAMPALTSNATFSGIATGNNNGIVVITVRCDHKIITPKLMALLRAILAELGFMLLAATINDGEQTLVVKPLARCAVNGLIYGVVLGIRFNDVLGISFNAGVVLGAKLYVAMNNIFVTTNYSFAMATAPYLRAWNSVECVLNVPLLANGMCINVSIVSQSSTSLALAQASMVMLCLFALAETTSTVCMPMQVVFSVILFITLSENTGEVMCLTISACLCASLMVMMFMSETLQFSGVFASALVCTLSCNPVTALVSLGNGAQTVTYILTCLGMNCSSMITITLLANGMCVMYSNNFNMFAFALGVVMSVIFTLVHNGDRASQELFINNYFGRCASTVATSIHATHVVMCGMFVRVQAGIYYYSGLTTESVIMMTYCHMVEVLWLVIMTFTMLSHVVCAAMFSMPELTSTVCHKFISGFYWTAGVIGLMWAFVNSIMQRLELVSPGQRMFLNTDMYNVYITGHGLLMIFGFAMPMLFGAFGNLLVPLLIHSPEVGYAKLNNFSYVIYVSSLQLVLEAHLQDVMTGLGWTIYPPLSTAGTLLAAYGINLVIMGLTVMGFSTTLSSQNFISTACLRSAAFHAVPCLGMEQFACAVMYGNALPRAEIGTTTHSFITTSVLLVLVLPILGLALVQLICDTYFNTCYFSNEVAGGDVVLYRHLFWFFGHPEVYVLILPGFGLASLIYALHTGNHVYGEMIMILGVWCIAVLGTFVWAHHMYTTSLETDTRAFYTMMTMMIAVPTGTKIYNYAVTLHRYTDSQSTSKSSLYTFILVIFVILFSFGGATGVILGNAQVDITLHDCYYVVAHFHYVLSLGTSLSIVLGTILMTDLMLINSIPVVSSNNTPVQYVVVMVVLSQSTIFFSMHILGFRTLPRRYVDASDNIYIQAAVATYSLLQQVLAVGVVALPQSGAGALGTPRPRVCLRPAETPLAWLLQCEPSSVFINFTGLGPTLTEWAANNPNAGAVTVITLVNIGTA